MQVYIHNVIHFWKVLECIPVRAEALKSLKGVIRGGCSCIHCMHTVKSGRKIHKKDMANMSI